MKLWKFWVWGKLFMMLIVIGMAFSIGTPNTQSEVIYVDEDIGIEQMDIDNTFVPIEFEKDFDHKWYNEAEVEISPGDMFVYVSSTSNNYDRKETLLGSLYVINSTGYCHTQFDNSNNTWVDKLNHRYETSTKNNKNHFRLDRSRCLIYTGNIAQMKNT